MQHTQHEFATGNLYAEWESYTEREALIAMLRIKDADMRVLVMEQARDAIDKAVHAGGAYSTMIPLVSLYYGGILEYRLDDPTSTEQDAFVLSKGHAVAAMAAVFADLGYFGREVLKNSRSYQSILNGHPGPILPGVAVSTGPMGQGLSVAQGLALAGRNHFNYDTYCITGDGELQEGNIWEGVMFSGSEKVDNLCVIVDYNHGQLDDPRRLHLAPIDIGKQFEAFGWRAVTVDGTQYGPVLDALRWFKYGPRDGRPTVIISSTKKGFGGLSSFLVGHKVTVPNQVVDQEISLQLGERERHVLELQGHLMKLRQTPDSWERIVEHGRKINLEMGPDKAPSCAPLSPEVRIARAPKREKRIRYNADELPRLDGAKNHSCSQVITEAMKVFARDSRVVSIDADLAGTSGLFGGTSWVDSRRALNVGVAEANMMCIGEAYAALGFNTWVSTFCPFFNWNVLRRIAISHQERIEASHSDGWLSEGHGLDLTFLATGPNFETRTNGATHMGNDDALVFGEIAHLKIIDVSCPNQLLGIMKWIMEGNRGLVYVRIMRSASAILYPEPPAFEFGKGYTLREEADAQAVIVSSGRQVHESLQAADLLAQRGIAVSVIDMPSFDDRILFDALDHGKLVVLAEQNNGILYAGLQKAAFRAKRPIDPNRILALNALDRNGEPQYIHSGEYDELVTQFELSPEQIAERLVAALK